MIKFLQTRPGLVMVVSMVVTLVLVIAGSITAYHASYSEVGRQWLPYIPVAVAAVLVVGFSLLLVMGNVLKK